MAFVALGQSSAPAKSGELKSSGRVALLLLLPGLIYLGLFFLTPFISLIITSLKTAHPSGVIGMYDFAFQVSNYSWAVESYLPQILRSFAYALTATLLPAAIA